MNDKPVLQTPGEKLAGLRLAADRSLDDLAEATKIPLPMLLAIEQDEYHKISGELYVKSFLRSYAAELGLEAEEILNLYGNFTGAVTAPASSAEDGAPVWQEEEIQIKRLGLPWLTIGIIATAVVVVAVGGYLLFRGNDKVDEAVPATPDVQQQAPDSTSGSRAAAEDKGPAPVFQESLLARNSSDSKEEIAEPEEVPVQDVQQPAAGTVPAALPAAPAGQPEQLEIEDRTWPVVLRLVCPDARAISLKKDGDRQYSQVDWPGKGRPLPRDGIRAGQAYHVQDGLVVFWGAEDHFSLKLDNPAGCRATINGQYRDISGLGPGEEIILNDPDVIRSNLPSARSADRP
jgi:cytoskeletal protein RodZ